MVAKLWAEQGFEPGRLDAGTVEGYATELFGGVSSGFGREMPGVDWETPDGETLRALRTNTWQFSAAKTHQEMAAISRELIGPDGRLRSFDDFRDAARRINIDHVKHLGTEYNTAVAGGQMAGKWERIQRDRDTLPFLQFDAVMDGRTSDTCAGLDGVVRRVEDALWKRYYPPNHFNCRSTVRQLADAVETPVDRIAAPDIPRMFQTNLGEQGLAFPPDHPYYLGTAAEGPGSIKSFGGAEYRPVTDRTGKGRVYESGAAHNPKKAGDPRYEAEYLDRRSVIDRMADYLGTDAYMLPELDDPRKDWRYGYFFEGSPKSGLFRQPDFKIGKEFWEMESYEGAFRRNKVGRMISYGADQADNVVIRLLHDISPDALENYVKNYFSQKKAKPVKRVVVISPKMEVVLDRPA